MLVKQRTLWNQRSGTQTNEPERVLATDEFWGFIIGTLGYGRHTFQMSGDSFFVRTEDVGYWTEHILSGPTGELEAFRKVVLAYVRLKAVWGDRTATVSLETLARQEARGESIYLHVGEHIYMDRQFERFLLLTVGIDIEHDQETHQRYRHYFDQGRVHTLVAAVCLSAETGMPLDELLN